MNITGKPVGYQRGVYDELCEIAADFFDFDWSSLAVAPRMNVLLCGSTGGGKTYLCRRLAAQLGLPLLDLEYAGWVVTGANSRGGAHTLRLAYNFVQRHARGIICLDEVDKLGSAQETSDWTRCVHLEVFSLLDRRVLAGVVEGADPSDDAPRFRMKSEEIQSRLRHGHLVVGAGAWQHLWRRVPAAGFGQTEPAPQLPAYNELAELIRPEVLNRFHSQVLFLPPLARADYESLVQEILPELPESFRPIITEAARVTVAQAVATQKGFRWIEELVGHAIRAVRTSADKTNLTLEMAKLCSLKSPLTDEIDRLPNR